MEFEGIMRSEISQTVTNVYCMMSLVCGIFKKTKQNKTQAHIPPEVGGEDEPNG